jgi:ribosomal protein S18 acetylase RimI-like enzyme
MTNKYILSDPKEDELASAVHENLYALFRSMQAIPGCELAEKEELSLHHSFPTNPMFKGAWKTRLPAEETEVKIDEVMDWFNQRDAPSFFWWTDPQTKPLDLAEQLMKRGFDGNLEGDPGMVLDLRELNENIPFPSQLKIKRAIDQESLEDWRDIFCEAYGSQTSHGQAWIEATLAAGQENAPWQLYVGYLEGDPVSTSMIFNGAGVTGVYAVGILPAFRNMGIGSAMTLKPLSNARQQGYHYAVLFSSRLGSPVYKRLGFREAAGKIGVYVMERD